MPRRRPSALRHALRAPAATVASTGLAALAIGSPPAVAQGSSSLALSASVPTVVAGSPVTLRAVLRNGAGRPLPNTTFGLYRRATVGSPWMGVHGMTTDEQGVATMTFATSATYQFYVGWAGTSTVAGTASAPVTITVKRPSTMVLAPAAVAVPSGTAVILTVAVRNDMGPIPYTSLALYRRSSDTAPWQGVHVLTTDRLGNTRIGYTAGARYAFLAQYGGNALNGPSTSNLSTVAIKAPAVTPSPSGLGPAAVAEAARHAGAPYVYGAAGPSAFDCSGFTMYVFGRLGRSLPHSSAAQYGVVRHVSASAKMPGDLIFFFTGGSVTHVGIYAGNGMMWIAPHTGDVVKLQRIYSSSYGVGRVG